MSFADNTEAYARAFARYAYGEPTRAERDPLLDELLRAGRDPDTWPVYRMLLEKDSLMEDDFDFYYASIVYHWVQEAPAAFAKDFIRDAKASERVAHLLITAIQDELSMSTPWLAPAVGKVISALVGWDNDKSQRMALIELDRVGRESDAPYTARLLEETMWSDADSAWAMASGERDPERKSRLTLWAFSLGSQDALRAVRDGSVGGFHALQWARKPASLVWNWIEAKVSADPVQSPSPELDNVLNAVGSSLQQEIRSSVVANSNMGRWLRMRAMDAVADPWHGEPSELFYELARLLLEPAKR